MLIPENEILTIRERSCGAAQFAHIVPSDGKQGPFNI
jgi:hypothetical protein